MRKLFLIILVILVLVLIPVFTFADLKQLDYGSNSGLITNDNALVQGLGRSISGSSTEITTWWHNTTGLGSVRPQIILYSCPINLFSLSGDNVCSWELDSNAGLLPFDSDTSTTTSFVFEWNPDDYYFLKFFCHTNCPGGTNSNLYVKGSDFNNFNYGEFIGYYDKIGFEDDLVNGDAYFHIDGINQSFYWYSGGEDYQNESYVKGLNIEWSEFNATTTKWDMGLKLSCFQDYENDPGWDILVVDLYDKDDNLLDTQFKGVSLADIPLIYGMLDTELQHSFEKFFTFENATGTATSTSYRVKTRFYDADADEYKAAQNFLIHLDSDYPYKTKAQWELEQAQKDSAEYADFEDKWGLMGRLADRLTSIKKRFPFSWLFEIYDIWKEEVDEHREAEDPPTFTLTIPTTTSVLGGVSMTILDFKTVNDDYGTWIGYFRTLFSYVIWLSTAFAVFYKTKGFIMRLKEED